MLHQPLRVNGAASRLLANWIGPFRVNKKLAHKTYELQNIDTGKVVTQTVTNMHEAPEPLYETEYEDRYKHVKNQTPPSLQELKEGMLILVNTERVGVVPAKVVQLLDDGTVVVDWYNGPAGKFSATSAVYPVYYDRAAKSKEVYTWKPTKQQEMDACWTIIRAQSR